MLKGSIRAPLKGAKTPLRGLTARRLIQPSTAMRLSPSSRGCDALPLSLLPSFFGVTLMRPVDIGAKAVASSVILAPEKLPRRYGY